MVIDPKRLQAAGLSVREVDTRARTNQRQRRRRLHRAQPRAFVIGTDGLVKNLDDLEAVVVGATPQGVPITIANVGDVRVRAAPAPRRRVEGRQGRGRRRRGADADGRELARRHGGGEGEARRAAAVAAGGHHASSRSTTAPTLVDRTITRSRRTSLEGAAPGDRRAVRAARATCARAWSSRSPSRSRCCSRSSVMNAVGISGNLMSLGAIDFGLIVDGAVIIVENAVRRLAERAARRDGASSRRGARRGGRARRRRRGRAAPASSAS